MFTNLKIKNFKSIVDYDFEFKPFTILSGTNSSGKSSVIQSILFYSYHSNADIYLEEYLGNFGNGQVKTSDFQEKQNIKEKLLGEKKYDIMENNTDYTEIININKQQTQDFQYANILKALQQSLQDLKSKQKSATLNEYANINIKDFESIIENIPLIKSTRLMNTLVLSLIAKELYSPIFEEMEEDIFIKYLQSAIQGNIKEDKILFENLAIKALENYIKKL